MKVDVARRGRALHAFVATCIAVAAAAYGVCTEVGADALLAAHRALPTRSHEGAPGRERAIVLLTGNHAWRVPEAARLQLTTGLPLLVSGRNAGYYYKLLRAAGVSTLWKEPFSVNTEQNAAYSACLLKKKGIDKIYVVTDDAHMARGLAWLHYYGLSATRASSGPPWPGKTSNRWTPSRIGWSRSKAIVHEWLGLADFYALSLIGRRLECPAAARAAGRLDGAASDLVPAAPRVPCTSRLAEFSSRRCGRNLGLSERIVRVFIPYFLDRSSLCVRPTI